MPHDLTFSVLHAYNSGEPGITLPIRLRSGTGVIDLNAKLDTGSSYCIFQRNYADMLDIIVEDGKKETIGTANSFFIAYGHDVSIFAFDFEFHATVFFAGDYHISRNVLGRQGWLDRVRLGLIDYDGYLYVSDYNDNSK